MAMLKHKYSSQDVLVKKKEEVFSGFFKMLQITLRYKLFSGEWSKFIKRELFQRNAAVGILLYDPIHKLVGLIEQFRIGALDERSGPWLFEVVAGMVDSGESLEEAALREVKEEVGIEDIQLKHICEYWVSPGGTNERMHLYCGVTNLVGLKGNFGMNEHSEDISLHIIAEDDVFLCLKKGQCNNAATTISLMWLQKHSDSFSSMPVSSDQMWSKSFGS
jgi:ADP-ribose pyrophosphatase